jgi:hypothetical protein
MSGQETDMRWIPFLNSFAAARPLAAEEPESRRDQGIPPRLERYIADLRPAFGSAAQRLPAQ